MSWSYRGKVSAPKPGLSFTSSLKGTVLLYWLSIYVFIIIVFHTNHWSDILIETAILIVNVILFHKLLMPNFYHKYLYSIQVVSEWNISTVCHDY